VPIQLDHGLSTLRFPVQSVIRPDRNFRGFSGRVASGRIRPGDAIVALPSGQQTRVQAIVSYDGELGEAIPSQSVVLKLEKEIDLSRGDMIVSAERPPHVSSRFAAMVVWLHERPLKLGQTYLLKHAGRQVKAKATGIRFRIDVNALTEHPANQLEMNGIAFAEFESSTPLYFDPYSRNRTTGSFILIDPLSNATVGAAMIREDLGQQELAGVPRTTGTGKRRNGGVSAEERHKEHGHGPGIFCVEGSSSFAALLERTLFENGFEAVLVNAEEVPFSALSIIVSSLWDAGLVIIYSGARLTPEERTALENFVDERVFEIPLTGSSEASQEVLKQALANAETLRVVNRSMDERKVN
jgi:hypothetical protein